MLRPGQCRTACAGHLELVRYLVGQTGFDPNYKMHPFQESWLICAGDHGHSAIEALLRASAADPGLARAWEDTGIIDRGQSETACRFQRMAGQGDRYAVQSSLEEDPSLALNEDMFGERGSSPCPPGTGIGP